MITDLFACQHILFQNIINKQIACFYSDEQNEVAELLLEKLVLLGNHVEMIKCPINNYVDNYIPHIVEENKLFIPNYEGKEFDILIIFTPLPPALCSDCLYRSLQTIEIKRGNIIYFDWPSISVYGKNSYALLQKLYKSAIKVDYNFILNKNNELKQILKNGNRFRMIDDEGTDLCFMKHDGIVLCESGIYDAENNIQQIPGGETFMPISVKDTNGKIALLHRRVIKIFEVIEGFVHLSNLSEEYQDTHISEFGIGTNPNVSYISNLSISEKSYGTCHFGFGNNVAFGGDVDYDFHFDITFSNFKLYVDGILLEI